MTLNIDTFSNLSGGQSLFKALGHPLCADQAHALIATLSRGGPIAIYDPLGYAESFAVLYELSAVDIAGVYVRDRANIGQPYLGTRARPVTEIGGTEAKAVLVCTFDAERFIDPIRFLMPLDIELLSFDQIRLPERMLTNPARYLDNLNFATNYALFRDSAGIHTRLVTANYWQRYGAKSTRLWLRLFDQDGDVLAEWEETLADQVGSIELDSREIRARFALPDFTGSLFIHAVGVAGHDVVKYALDTYGDDETVLSCTHDANPWPSELYAGVPAPAATESVALWVQNSHPCAIPANSVGFNVMGVDAVRFHGEEVPPFGTRAIDVGKILPAARWPQQIEIRAGKHFVRPRYEILDHTSGRTRIAHANVERTDLEPNAEIPEIQPLFGKGFLLPISILPPERWRTEVLPTPMSTRQSNLPVQLLVYSPSGEQVGREPCGQLARDHATVLDVTSMLPPGFALAHEFGHCELCYDFDSGAGVDGWLHALIRYTDHQEQGGNHVAETSFGAHIFNTALTYRDEPQSYSGAPPGLSTRLFLPLADGEADTLCHLIYPASTPWRATSDTALILHDACGNEVANRTVSIPCSGSMLWRYRETFSEAERAHAGKHAYALIRDSTCRLFGYHGVDNNGSAFSFDHMFGF